MKTLTGTVRKKKRAKNRWILTVRFGYDSRGREVRREKTITAVNKAEAQRQLNSWMAELENANLNSSELTLPDFAALWLPQHAAKKQLAPRTVDSYERLIKRYIRPYFQDVLLTEVTPIMLESFFVQLLTEKSNVKQRRSKDGCLSPRTVRNVYSLLSGIFRAAYQWEKICTNPMNKVDSPSGKSQLPTVFQLATVRKIFKALSNEDFQFQLLVLLAVTTGCREGELLGLSWDDYSSAEGTFWIHQTVQYLPQKGTYIHLRPKTDHSCRHVLIVPQLRPLLEEQRDEYEALKSQAGKRWNAAHLVFFNPNGTPVRPNSVSNHFTNFIRKNGIEHMRFHDLRGFFATRLMSQGYSLADIIRRTGHSRASTLLDYYGHALAENRKDIDTAITESFDAIRKLP